MAGFTLTLALEHYDRHLPLLEGKVVPEGFAVHVEHVTVEEGRHERMLHHRAWDACELSLSSYLMAKARSAPLTAVPVFPRRLFSQSQMYINTGAGIAAPRDLIGKRVGLRSFQTTLSVLAKGDLQHEYGVPLDQVTWVTSADEPVPFAPPPGVCIERAPRDQQIETMLVDGAVQAYMVPRMPRTFVQGSPQVARLFQDPRAVERVYYQRNGFYPIMHVLAVKPEVLDAHPQVAMCLFDAFERAKEMAFHYYDDPNWSHLAWAAHLLRSAPWITMSNSLATTPRMWDAQIEACTSRYRVLRYDKRGHGESDVPEGPYSFELLANDVLALLEALNITHTHFIGLSMGGMTGMTLALQQPSVLRSLVLCDTASADPLGDPTLWQERIDALKGSDSMEPLVERTIERFLAPATVQSRPETVAAVRDMIRHTPVQGYIACCQALAKLHLTERLPGIQIPTLVVVGEQDVATPVALARDIQQRIPGAELVLLKDAGHLSNIDQPEAFNKAVLEFLARH